MFHYISWIGYSNPSIICLQSIYSIISLPAPHAYKTDPGSHYFYSLTLPHPCSSLKVLSQWPQGILEAPQFSLKPAFWAINPMLSNIVISYFHANNSHVLIFIVLLFTSRALTLTFLWVFTIAECWACRRCSVKNSWMKGTMRETSLNHTVAMAS